MAVTSPAQDPARSPASGPPPDAAAGTGRPDGGTSPSRPGDDRNLDLSLVRAVIEDGVLMVLGPDGDPVPPQSFAAAAAEQPDALVRLGDKPLIRAARIAAVLDAQRGGRLGSDGGGDGAWIEAMLGIGPAPEMASADELDRERHGVEIIVFGKEMMITSPAGGTFLAAEARAATPTSVRLLGADGEPLALGAVVARLLGRTEAPAAGAVPAKVNERTLADCKTWIEDDALVIELAEVGAVRFARYDPGAAEGPAVSVFTPDGEIAAIDELMGALSRSPTTPQDYAARRDPDGPRPIETPADRDPTPASAPCQSPAGSSLPVPLAIRLPDTPGARPDEVALVVVRRLPAGASLSAGVAGGDGSWLLSPSDLHGLSLQLPPGWTCDLALEMVAIAVQDRDGELASASSTTEVALRPASSGHVPAPIPIPVDPQMLSRHGPMDAIIVRDLPADATLSAGAYDPAIDGWVLLPRQLGGLTVTPEAWRSEDFTITLLGVRLSDGGARPRLLVRVPIAIS
jgi:hypothetical protein